MMVESPNVVRLLLFLALPPLLLGLVLVKLAYFPRRRGDTPHCRKCNYTLTGLSSERCPECGEVLNEETIVHGERTRRPILGGVASLLLLLALANTGIILASGQIDWYRYKPTSWVIDDAASPTPAMATRAWTELQRRMNEGSLAENQRAKLTEVALAEQAKPSDGPIGRSLRNYLGTGAAEGKLSEAQKVRFVDQGVRFTLSARQRVAKGDPVYYRLAYTARGPDEGWWSNHGVKEIRIDGKKLSGGSFSSSGTSSGSGGGAAATTMKFDEPGPHTLELNLDQTMWHGRTSDLKKGTQFLARVVTVKATFEVLADPPSDLVKLTADEDVRTELLTNIKVTKAVLTPDSQYLHVNLDVRPLSVNIAFDAFARVGEQEFSMSTMTLAKGTPMGFGLGGGEEFVKKHGRPQRITVILRSSDQAARRSIEIYEAWKGELVFEDVPVSDKW